MSELLDAIYASPDDDAPRLVYADALLERGDRRGELIVRQCNGDAARDLVEEFGDAWLGELAPVIAASTYERGFLSKVTIREPRDDKAIAALVGHPLWRTVRELRGSAAIALHPSMTALRVLAVSREPAHWRELLTGTPRDIAELVYVPTIDEDWDPDGDVTATPSSGGVWSIRISHEEFAALAECTALPKLRKLFVPKLPDAALPLLLGGSLLDRVPIVEFMISTFRITIAGGLASIDSPMMWPSMTAELVRLIGRLPAHLGIAIKAPPKFDRTPIEQLLGPRLRR